MQAYNYTTLLSCELLDAWAIPSCLFFSWLWMRPRYKLSQLLGVLVCVGGLGMLVASDELTDKDWPALSRAKGDVFMIVGATLYGFSEHLCLCLLHPAFGKAADYMLLTSIYSERNGGVLCAKIAALRSCRPAGHVGHDHQRHSGCRPRA